MKIKVFILFISAFTISCKWMVIPKEDASSKAMSGRYLSTKEAESLENKIKENPGDIESRTILLGYYTRKQFRNKSARKSKQKHVLWLIVNSPEAEVLGLPYGTHDAIRDKGLYDQCKKAWLNQIQLKPENLKILKNCSKYFQRHDQSLAIEFLKKGRTLDINNPYWPAELGHIYLRESNRSPADSQIEIAKKALKQLEIAYSLGNEIKQDFLLKHLAKSAFAAHDSKKAMDYAKKMLEKSRAFSNNGNNIHHGNIILGRIALSMGELEEAKSRLVKAGETPGSPTLMSFGPNMSLAKELLEVEESEAVLVYFQLCSKFWEGDGGQLEEWTQIVNKGEIPDFGANLFY